MKNQINKVNEKHEQIQIIMVSLNSLSKSPMSNIIQYPSIQQFNINYQLYYLYMALIFNSNISQYFTNLTLEMNTRSKGNKKTTKENPKRDQMRSGLNSNNPTSQRNDNQSYNMVEVQYKFKSQKKAEKREQKEREKKRREEKRMQKEDSDSELKGLEKKQQVHQQDRQSIEKPQKISEVNTRKDEKLNSLQLRIVQLLNKKDKYAPEIYSGKMQALLNEISQKQQEKLEQKQAKMKSRDHNNYSIQRMNFQKQFNKGIEYSDKDEEQLNAQVEINKQRQLKQRKGQDRRCQEQGQYQERQQKLKNLAIQKQNIKNEKGTRLELEERLQSIIQQANLIQLNHLQKQWKINSSERRTRSSKVSETQQTLNYFYYIQQNIPRRYDDHLLKYSLNVCSKDQFYKKKNQIYINQLKIQFYEIYIMLLNEEGSSKMEQQIEQTKELIFNYFFTMLQNSQIFFLAFKFQNDIVEKKYRKFLIRIVFNRAFQMIKQPKNKKISNLQKLFKKLGVKYLLNILTAKESFINYDLQLKQKIKEQVKIIKNSWYVRMVLSKFLKGRYNKQKFQKKQINKSSIEITQELIYKKLQETQINFVDFPDKIEGGQTDIKDIQKVYPIFINTIRQFQSFQYKHQLILVFTMCTILHQLEHSLIRRLQLVGSEENSYADDQNIDQPLQDLKVNLQNVEENPKVKKQGECGWLFERYFFGGRVDYFVLGDYSKVKKLLQLELNPDLDVQNWDCQGNEQKCKNFVINDVKVKQIQKRQISEQQNQNQNQNQKKQKQDEVSSKLPILIKQKIAQANNLISNLQKKNGIIEEKLKNQNYIKSFGLKINFISQFNKARQINEAQKQLEKDSSENQSQQFKQVQNNKEEGEKLSLGQIKEMIKIVQTLGCRTKPMIKSLKTKYLQRKRIYQTQNGQSQQQQYENVSFARTKPCFMRKWYL